MALSSERPSQFIPRFPLRIVRPVFAYVPRTSKLQPAIDYPNQPLRRTEDQTRYPSEVLKSHTHSAFNSPVAGAWVCNWAVC